MKQIIANIINAFTNLHVSLPVLGAAAFGVSAIIWPQDAAKLNSIAAVLAGYSIIASSNTPTDKQTPPK